MTKKQGIFFLIRSALLFLALTTGFKAGRHIGHSYDRDLNKLTVRVCGQ
ncbi:MAG: hypothetical protein LBF85_05585 [Tannerella sp.]|nr:hypothetical protein [Tannerella sp.]